uniref:transcription factor IIIA-like isoform X2 n=1 Tax=Myxine glutinosa TaxID=7769 RepID=UPI00358E4E37
MSVVRDVDIAYPDASKSKMRAVNDKLYICSFDGCSAVFSSSRRLRHHLCRHTGKFPFVCFFDGCEKAFVRRCHLQDHQRTHTGERPFKCTVEGCKNAFTLQKNLLRHIKSMHDNEAKIHKCCYGNCAKRFKTEEKLRVHCSEHTNTMPFTCSFEGCGKMFPISSQLRRHKKIHQEEPEYICKECGYGVRRSDLLKRHKLTHSLDRPRYVCPEPGCGHSYTTPSMRRYHVLAQHKGNSPYQCHIPECGKAFMSKQKLQYHLSTHGSPKIKNVTCPKPRLSLAAELSGYCGDDIVA